MAEERGHPSPSVLVDEDGRALTHPDYVDYAGASHQRGGAWAFSRRPAWEAVGLLSGSDWVRDHCPTMLIDDGSPYPYEPRLPRQLYIQRFGWSQPHMMGPVVEAGAPSFRLDGSRVCFIEDGTMGDDEHAARYLLWEYELGLGHRRLITAWPRGAFVGPADATYSPDGAYIHVCGWATGYNALVRVEDGLVVPLPFRTPAAGWNPAAGPNAMVVMTPKDDGSLDVSDFDVATAASAHRCTLHAHNDVELIVRQLSMSVDGRALVTAPVGAPGLDQLQRGGVQVAAIIDLDSAGIEPVLPAAFRTAGAQRRHANPRWCEDLGRVDRGPTAVADALLANGYQPGYATGTGGSIPTDVTAWVDVLETIETAWSAGVVPRHRFATEFAQYALGCLEHPDGKDLDVLRRFRREHVSRHQVPRVVAGWIEAERRMWPPLSPEAVDERPPARGAVAPQGLEEVLDAVITAEGPVARRKAIVLLPRVLAVEPRRVWRHLVGLTDGLLRDRHYPLVAKVALMTYLWNYFNPAGSAAPPIGLTDRADATPLMVNGFEACTHLSERQVLGRDPYTMYDVETVRNCCHRALAQLPVDEWLKSNARPTRISPPPFDMPDPARMSHRRKVVDPMRKKVVFASYLHENRPQVDPVVRRLRAEGVEVWLDETSLEPGKPWESETERAIRTSDHFVAFFSRAYSERTRTYMNEELRLAVRELRYMPHGASWFIPILIEPCEVPDMKIDATMTLRGIQYVDFTADWEEAMRRLVRVITRDSEE